MEFKILFLKLLCKLEEYLRKKSIRVILQVDFYIAFIQITHLNVLKNKIITNFYTSMKRTEDTGIRKKLEDYSYLLS